MTDITILGAGLYAAPIIELAIDCGYRPVEIYDNDRSQIGKTILDVPVVGVDEDLFMEELRGKCCAISIGNNKIRSKIYDELINRGANVPSLIHNTAYVSPSAKIGDGSYIQPHAVIWSFVELKESVIISPSTIIAHHTEVGKSSMISTQSSIGSGIKIGENVLVGMGSTIMTGVNEIGNNVIIGAGSVVIKNVEAGSTVVGVPARRIK
jgi:sugar O-acyltransferase (sialic acid O-acetyltransferase NeuD family)